MFHTFSNDFYRAKLHFSNESAKFLLFFYRLFVFTMSFLTLNPRQAQKVVAEGESLYLGKGFWGEEDEFFDYFILYKITKFFSISTIWLSLTPQSLAKCCYSSQIRQYTPPPKTLVTPSTPST